MSPRPTAPVDGSTLPCHTSNVAGLLLSDELLEHVASLVADRVAQRLSVASEPWLDVEAAAAHLGVEKHRVYDLVAQRRVRHFKDGRSLRFRRSDLDDSLEEVERRA